MNGKIVAKGIIAVIPARGGSKGVPMKNIKPLAGIPLIAYSIAAAKRCPSIGRIMVSTDSPQIAAAAVSSGAEAPFLRPAAIAGDASTDYEFFRHLLDWLAEHEGAIPEYMVHLRPTTPLREVRYIEAAIEAVRNDPACTALRSVHEMAQTAYKAFTIQDGFLRCMCTGAPELDDANNARQGYPKTYRANGYVDVVKSSYINEFKKIHGNRVIAFVTPSVEEVDTMDEFAYLEHLIAMKPHLLKELFPS